MSHLNSVYARSLGVKIGYPVFQPHFFPFLEEKYITFHNSDKCPSKSYSYWPDTIKILKPEFEKRGIKIIQIGAKEDKQVDGVDLFLNGCSIKQSAYILQKARLHLGIDSMPVHAASALGKPTVSLYAHAPKELCNPLWNQDKAILIESDRGGKKPSFSNHEDPKEIDRIKPEEIAESVFKLLNITKYNSQKTIFIGKKYLHKTIDIIPSSNPKEINVSDANVRIRMDLAFNEDVLKTILHYTNGKVEILTKDPISKEIINHFKGKISKVIYDSSNFNGEFLEFLRKSGIPFELNCLSKSKLAEQRLKFFHYEIHLSQKEEDAKKLMKENKVLPKNLEFYSNRIYVEGQNVMMTLSKKIGDLQFWIDAKYFRVFQNYCRN